MRFLTIVFLLGCCACLRAQQVTFYANISGDYSETSWIGHAWVGFSDGVSTIKRGFHPGGLRDESRRPSDISYTFRVSRAQYEQGLAVIEAYSSHLYILGGRDCRGFAYDVARAIGLRVPGKGIKSPAEWVADLVEMN